MEKNTVVLDLIEYNKLRDFRKGILKNNVYQIVVSSYEHFSIISTNKVVKSLASINKSLSSKIYDLENPKKKEITLEDIKKMSYWEFRKWRKTNV